MPDTSAENEIAFDDTDFELTDVGGPVRHFDGDTGTKPFDLRVAIAKLLIGPYLSGDEDEKSWAALVTHLDLAQSHLSDTFQVLIVDKERRVAFVRQAVSDTRFPAMIERRRFNLVDSAVIVYLRRRIAESAGTGRHIVVSLDEIRDELLSFRQLRNTNEAGRRRDIDNSVTRMKSHGILKKLRDSDDRYTIAPVLTVLFPLEEINALLAALRSVSDGTAGDLTEEPDGEQTDD